MTDGPVIELIEYYEFLVSCWRAKLTWRWVPELEKVQLRAWITDLEAKIAELELISHT